MNISFKYPGFNSFTHSNTSIANKRNVIILIPENSLWITWPEIVQHKTRFFNILNSVERFRTSGHPYNRTVIKILYHKWFVNDHTTFVVNIFLGLWRMISCLSHIWVADLVTHINHYDVIKWKHFPHYWLFVQGIHPAQRPVGSGALMFSLICVWINGWVNNLEPGDLRRYCAHYDVTVMTSVTIGHVTVSAVYWTSLLVPYLWAKKNHIPYFLYRCPILNCVIVIWLHGRVPGAPFTNMVLL